VRLDAMLDDMLSWPLDEIFITHKHSWARYPKRNGLPASRSGRRRYVALAAERGGAPGEIRTPDHLVRSQVLYPTELRARGAGF
jgi:hypothetical protein